MFNKNFEFWNKKYDAEYIARNDYDDFSQKDRLLIQMNKLAENKSLKMVYSYFDFVDINGNLIRKKNQIIFFGFSLKKILCKIQ